MDKFLRLFLDNVNPKMLYYDNWMLGCNCWRLLFNSLDQEVENNPCFRKEVRNNVMKITIMDCGEPFSFYVYRVDESTRKPTSGTGLQKHLYEQLWLSDEIRGTVLAGSNGVNALGYDISIQSGLGRISLVRLIAKGGNKAEPVYLHCFETPTHASPYAHHTENAVKPEEISKPAVIRKNPENCQAEKLATQTAI